MEYQFRGDIAHADIAFDASGQTLEEVFAAAAEATLRVMVDESTSIEPQQTIELTLEQSDEEMLLFDFLNELIFYKDARRLFLLPSRLSFSRDSKRISLVATLQGEEIDPERHHLLTDVKAVTMHRFSLVRSQEGWKTTVVLDV